MVIYLSGNFPQLSKIEKERAFKKKLEAEGFNYHRLGTFFYPKAMDTVLELKQEELNESKSQRTVGSNQQSETRVEQERSDRTSESPGVRRRRSSNV